MTDNSKPRTVTHPACGAVWPNTERHSHCSACHQTFGNHRIGNRHRRTLDGVRTCTSPAALPFNGAPPVLTAGIWNIDPQARTRTPAKRCPQQVN
jgi:hypothetical protein